MGGARRVHPNPRTISMRRNSLHLSLPETSDKCMDDVHQHSKVQENVRLNSPAKSGGISPIRGRAGNSRPAFETILQTPTQGTPRVHPNPKTMSMRRNSLHLSLPETSDKCM